MKHIDRIVGITIAIAIVLMAGIYIFGELSKHFGQAVEARVELAADQIQIEPIAPDPEESSTIPSEGLICFEIPEGGNFLMCHEDRETMEALLEKLGEEYFENGGVLKEDSEGVEL